MFRDKNDIDRVNGTLAFLQNSLALPAEDRELLTWFARDFVVRRFNNNFETVGFREFSRQMSFGYRFGQADPGNLRQRARASFLLQSAWKFLVGGAPLALVHARAINNGTIDANIAAMLPQLRRVRANRANAVTFLAARRQELLANPLNYLQNNKIFIAGSSAVTPPAPLLPVGTPVNLRFCSLRYREDLDRLDFQVDVRGPGEFQVDSVPAFHWAHERNLPPGPPAPALHTAQFDNMQAFAMSGGVDRIMVTTQFTGCSFLYAEDGGVSCCMHVAPQESRLGKDLYPDVAGDALAMRLQGRARFGNAHGVAARVYGRNAGDLSYDLGGGSGANGSSVNIIGVPVVGRRYRFFAQVTRANQLHSVTELI